MMMQSKLHLNSPAEAEMERHYFIVKNYLKDPQAFKVALEEKFGKAPDIGLSTEHSRLLSMDPDRALKDALAFFQSQKEYDQLKQMDVSGSNIMTYYSCQECLFDTRIKLWMQGYITDDEL